MALTLNNLAIILTMKNGVLSVTYNGTLGSTDSTKLNTLISSDITSQVQSADITALTTEYNTLLAIINSNNGIS